MSVPFVFYKCSFCFSFVLVVPLAKLHNKNFQTFLIEELEGIINFQGLIMFCIFTESLTELMVTIVDLSPSCCKSSHLPVLFAAYSASLSVTGKATFSADVRS